MPLRQETRSDRRLKKNCNTHRSLDNGWLQWSRRLLCLCSSALHYEVWWAEVPVILDL